MTIIVLRTRLVAWLDKDQKPSVLVCPNSWKGRDFVKTAKIAWNLHWSSKTISKTLQVNKIFFFTRLFNSRSLYGFPVFRLELIRLDSLLKILSRFVRTISWSYPSSALLLNLSSTDVLEDDIAMRFNADLTKKRSCKTIT